MKNRKKGWKKKFIATCTVIAGVAGFLATWPAILSFFDIKPNIIGQWVINNFIMLFGIIFLLFILSFLIYQYRKVKNIDNGNAHEYEYSQIFEPVEYIPGTKIPAPRLIKKEDDETIEHYEDYLAMFYDQFGILVDRFKVPRAPYPHEKIYINGKTEYSDYYLKISGKSNLELLENEFDYYDNELLTHYGYSKYNKKGNYDELSYVEQRQLLINYITYLDHKVMGNPELHDFVENIINGKRGLWQTINTLERLIEDEEVEAYRKRQQKK